MPERLASVGPILADAPAGALRIVVCHHHLAGAPWRASRKFPLKHRDTVLRALAAAGAELVLGGHIHQSTAVERHAFEALDDDARRSLVLATAPGFGRPRPDRLGEANGLHVVRWTADEIEIETRIWRSGSFEPTDACNAHLVIRGCYRRRARVTMRQPLVHSWKGRKIGHSQIAPSDDGPVPS